MKLLLLVALTTTAFYVDCCFQFQAVAVALVFPQ